MRSKNMTLAAVAGGALVAVVAMVCLSGGRASASSSGTAVRQGPATRPQAAARPRAAYAVTAAAGHDGAGAVSPVRSAAADGAEAKAAEARAKDLLGRLLAVGTAFDLPADLERDLLDFLAGGEANRDALFPLVWDPSTSRAVAGHVRLLIDRIQDAGLRGVLLAAFDSSDPEHAARAAVAAQAKDPSVFVASLRAAGTAKERLDLMRKIPQESWKDPHIAAWLIETARGDADEDVRGSAYLFLAFSGNAEALPVIVAAAADTGRSVTERKRAAFAMGQHPVKASTAEILRIYEGAPDEIRRNLIASLAVAPADRRIDDLLLEVLGGADTSDKTRKAAASAIQERLGVLPAAGARDLGTRTAEVVKSLGSENAVLALNALGGAVAYYEPLKEAVRELERTAPAGGAVQVALVNTPALRFALGRN